MKEFESKHEVVLRYEDNLIDDNEFTDMVVECSEMNA
jgi:hypothetical protein